MIKQNWIAGFIFTIILTQSFAQNVKNQFDGDGKRHGLWTKNYYQTDQKRYEGEFKHGKEVDTFKYYRLNKGKSVLSAIKVFNEKDSLADVIFYASNKKIISKGQMNGKRFTGKWVFYHNNSDRVMTIENYNNDGQLHGERLVYYKNGAIAEKSSYKNGKLEGLYEWFTENKVLLRISNYTNGQLNGKTTNYDANGEKDSEGLYKNDKKAGIWNYYENGVITKKIDHTNQKVIEKRN
jgi:antitoxin component YwqK of YwqJK toxin-antitoxin module